MYNINNNTGLSEITRCCFAKYGKNGEEFKLFHSNSSADFNLVGTAAPQSQDDSGSDEAQTHNDHGGVQGHKRVDNNVGFHDKAHEAEEIEQTFVEGLTSRLQFFFVFLGELCVAEDENIDGHGVQQERVLGNNRNTPSSENNSQEDDSQQSGSVGRGAEAVGFSKSLRQPAVAGIGDNDVAGTNEDAVYGGEQCSDGAKNQEQNTPLGAENRLSLSNQIGLAGGFAQRQNAFRNKADQAVEDNEENGNPKHDAGNILLGVLSNIREGSSILNGNTHGTQDAAGHEQTLAAIAQELGIGEVEDGLIDLANTNNKEHAQTNDQHNSDNTLDFGKNVHLKDVHQIENYQQNNRNQSGICTGEDADDVACAGYDHGGHANPAENTGIAEHARQLFAAHGADNGVFTAAEHQITGHKLHGHIDTEANSHADNKSNPNRETGVTHCITDVNDNGRADHCANEHQEQIPKAKFFHGSFSL